MTIVHRIVGIDSRTARGASRGRKVCVLLVSQVFAPDEQATSQLLADLVKKIESDSIHCVVVCGYPSSVSGGRAAGREDMDGVDVQRVGVVIDYKRSVIGRGVHYVCFLASALIQLVGREDVDLVVAVTNPPFLPIGVGLLCRIMRRQYALCLHDIYPDGLVALGKMGKSNPVVALWRAFNEFAFRNAERVAVLGRDMRELLMNEYRVSPGRIDVFPNWSIVAAPSHKTAEDTELFCRLGLQGKFVVQYSGNMGLWHDIESIIMAAARLQWCPAIHFLMIGDGIRRRDAIALAERFGLRNVTWLPFRAKDELPDSLASCHVALLSQRDGLAGVAVPCKLYGILAAGRPVIGIVPSTSEAALVIREELCGLVVPPGDVDALVSAICTMQENRKVADEMGKRAMAAADSKYNLRSAVASYRDAWISAASVNEGICI